MLKTKLQNNFSLWFLLEQGIVVFPTSVKPQRIAENMNVIDFTLSDEEMNKIEALDKYMSYKTNLKYNYILLRWQGCLLCWMNWYFWLKWNVKWHGSLGIWFLKYSMLAYGGCYAEMFIHQISIDFRNISLLSLFFHYCNNKNITREIYNSFCDAATGYLDSLYDYIVLLCSSDSSRMISFLVHTVFPLWST